MKVILEPQESEEIFYNILCNAVSTGYMSGYGLGLEYKNADYKEAKNSLVAEGKEDICFEDVLMQILKRGGQLVFEDSECDGEYTRTVTLADIHEKVQKAPFSRLVEMIQQEDDATTADVILQHVLYGKTIFG